VSTLDPTLRRRRKPPRRWSRKAALALGVLLVFLVGYGVGRAVDDNPRPGPLVTTIRTVDPAPAG
jgi:hypothetical protein